MLRKPQGAHNSRSCIHSAWKARCHCSCRSLLVLQHHKRKPLQSLWEHTEGETYCIHPAHFGALYSIPMKALKWERAQRDRLEWRKEQSKSQGRNKAGHRQCRCSLWHWNTTSNPSNSTIVPCQREKCLHWKPVGFLSLGEVMEKVGGMITAGGVLWSRNTNNKTQKYIYSFISQNSGCPAGVTVVI